MKTKFTVDYFIKKFEAIPDALWSEWLDGEGSDEPLYTPSKRCKTCAIGHCDRKGENTALGMDLFFNTLKITVSKVIHKQHPDYQQPTPKQRILAALYDIKAMTKDIDTGKKERIVYVAVPASITEQSKDLVLS